MDPLYLVDGSGYVFRAFYAIAPLSNSKGLPTNAVYGFTRMLIKLLRDMQVRHIAVTFDTGAPTFRHELYTDYKANRAECPEELIPQMPYFRKVVRALGIKCLEKEGVEADDIIATLALRFAELGRDVIVVSGDKDLTQLVNDHIEVWEPMRDIRFKREVVKEKFGVYPEQIVDFLALTGDSSDNVPGVKGIGPKTAQQLLEHFGSVDELIRRSTEINAVPGLRGAASVQKKIESALEDLRLSRELVSLDKLVTPFSSIEDIEEFRWDHAPRELAEALLDELEFANIKQSIEPYFAASDGAARTATAGHGPQTPAASRSFNMVKAEELAAFGEALCRQPAFAFDTETTSLDVHCCDLAGISICWEDGTAFYLPLRGPAGEADRLLELNAVREALGSAFADERIHKIGLNLKFDVNVLEQHGFTVRGFIFDGMLASYVINPDTRQHGLKALAKCHLNETMLSYEEVTEGAETIADAPLERVSEYACHDAHASFCLRRALEPLLGPVEDAENIPSLRYVFQQIEMPLVEVLARMERRGIKVDTAFLAKLSADFEAELKGIEQRIFGLAGREFNLNSPKQLSEILFDHLGLPTAGVKRTQSSFSTDAAVLTKLAENFDIARELLDYRELFKLRSTYTDALQKLVNPRTGRIHTSFNQAVAATGRLSSSEPNLQNIPIRNPRGRALRRAFVAEEGCKLISADYSQIELRILAHMSGDENLQLAFLRGEDIHLATAKDIFPNAEGVLGDLRRVAKTINFGVIYGISAFRLSDQLGVTRREAQRYIDEYFGRYPRVQGYFEQLEREAQERGYVETYFGRRRYLKDIDTSGRDRGYALRSSLNAPIQGTAADVIKIAMVNLDRALATLPGKAQIVLQVHDELVIEAEDRLIEQARELIVREMESAVIFRVPLKVDVEVSSSWGGNEE